MQSAEFVDLVLVFAAHFKIVLTSCRLICFGELSERQSGVEDGGYKPFKPSVVAL